MQRHPAPFSVPILDRIRELMQGEGKVRALDPFCGTGRALDALPPGSSATLIDIEPSCIQEGLERYVKGWDVNVPAMLYDEMLTTHPHGIKADWHVADSRLWLARNRRTYTHIITSPTYGNRYTDGYRSKPGVRCRSYAQSKGGPLLPGNTGAMKFGSAEYHDVNFEVMQAAVKRLVDGGLVIVNVSDFYKTLTKGGIPTRMPVVRLWVDLLHDCGLSMREVIPVKTRRFKEGENRHRVDYESILVFEKGDLYVGPSTRAASRA